LKSNVNYGDRYERNIKNYPVRDFCRTAKRSRSSNAFNCRPSPGGKYTAEFTKDGELIRPTGWREWVFVGSPLTPNSLNGGNASFPEFHSVYIDPESWAHWKETGTFREGTMFAKELTLVGETAATSGIGFFNGELQGFEIAHKDTSKYSAETDGWAYYTFGHKPEPYADSATAQPTAACAVCHTAAAADDMVFTQYYSILRAAKGAGDAGAGVGGDE
jgi:hypothetical protein